MIRRSFFLAILILTVLAASAQRNYFLYFQTENQQPFFLKMGEKLYSSTASGYLILPKLKDTTHFFSIGFPGREAQENFYYTMNHKDHGFLLKHFPEKGWGLFDLQTLGVQMASRMGSAPGESVIRTEKKEPNEFTDLLVKASNDTTLKERVILEEPVATVAVDTVQKVILDSPVVKVEEKKEIVTKDTIVFSKPVTDTPGISLAVKPSEPAVDTVRKQADEPVRQAEVPKEEPKVAEPVKQTEIPKEDPKEAVPVKEEPVRVISQTPEEPAYQLSKVIRRSESSTTGGFGIVFLDQFPDGKIDTVRILIPPAKAAPIVQNKPVEEKKTELKFLEILPDSVKQEAKPQRCPVLATEEDFFQVRREMAGEVSDAAMAEKAKKPLSQKCYSTLQIRNLGNLFLGDAGKLGFYQMAFPHVSDPESFGKLQEELKDPVVADRFRVWWEAQSTKSPQ